MLVNRTHPFRFDYTFNNDSTQVEVYQTCVYPLINQFLDGYNTTVLAYGPTGSGKTYTMGTTYKLKVSPADAARDKITNISYHH